MRTEFSWGVLLLAAVFVFPALSSRAHAQTGTLIGTVIDGEYGDGLIGANVQLEGTLIGTATGLDGSYRIDGIPAGTYDVRFSFIGYQTLTVEGVDILDRDITRVDATLALEAYELDGDVVVEARAIRNNEATLLRDRQKANAVSDAISAEAISRSGSGDAAAAMTKVTGASVVGGKYVYIRGLGDRYTSTTLNGSALPSADPDRKAFQLDLFPSALLENIVTLKTFTADKPGDFSGGLVNVSTKTFPEQFTLSFSTSVTYDDLSTGNPYLTAPGGNSDWRGTDDGTRALPSILEGKDPEARMPTEQDLRDLRRGVTNEIRAARADSLNAFADAFNGNMNPTTNTAPVNYSFSSAVGGQSRLFGMPVGYTGSLTYSRKYTVADDGVFSRWALTGGGVDDVDNLTTDTFFGGLSNTEFITRADSLELPSFGNRRGSEEVSWGGSTSLSMRPSPNHEITFTGLRSQSGLNEASVMSGFRDQNATATFLTRVISYQERSLKSGQLRGEHSVKPLTIEWALSAGENTQEEPDLRFMSSVQNIQQLAVGIDTTYSLGGGNAPPPQRYFRNLAEDTRSGKLDVGFQAPFWGPQRLRFKVGGSFEDTDRSFRQRRFEFETGRQINFANFEGNVDAFFSPENFGVLDTLHVGDVTAFNAGLFVLENSPARANYNAKRNVFAGYGMVDIPVTRHLKVIAGARIESTNIETTSLDDSLPDDIRVGTLDEVDVLPSVNTVFALTGNMNVRLAATRTLARPTFRELAPFQNFSFIGGDIQEGNPLLGRTLISNFDFRWEWFMQPGELVAVSLFYKEFDDPIERVLRTVGEGRFVSFQNVDEARVYGLELEARKNLRAFTASRLLRHVSVGGNFSLVESFVDIPEEELAIIRTANPDADDTRSLVGQSPFLLNLSLAYENPASRTAIGLFYTVFDDRLAAVTEGATPDIFEKSRGDLDLTVSQHMNQRFRLKFTAKNLLGSDNRQIQTFKNIDYDYTSFSRATTFSFGLTYNAH